MAKPLLQFASFAAKLRAPLLESGKLNIAAFILRNVEKDPINAFNRAMDAGDDTSVNELTKFMTEYDECVRDFDCYVYLGRTGRTGRVLEANRGRVEGSKRT